VEIDMTAPIEPLLTRTEAAAILGVKPDTLNHWTWKGTGPESVKVGGRVKYSRADLASWIAERKRISSNPVRDAELRAAQAA
jgi:predicted DNA-binding transcriptional regulator AlpA